MSYVNRSLNENEIVQFNVQYFWYERWFVYGAYVVGILTAVFIIGVLIFLWAFYTHVKIINTERAVTNFRVIQKKGIIAVETEELMIGAIETVTVHQSVLERLMGGGTVRVTGRGGIIINLTEIDEPLIVKKVIEQQRINYGLS